MFKFSKGEGEKAVRTPDTLTTKDTVEVLLGISQGPIKGLANGPKSFQADDTPLVNDNGTANFKNFLLDVWPGSELGHSIKMYLGGFSSPLNINQKLAHNTPVVRTGVLKNIDAIDFRIVVQQLLKSNDKGTFANELSLKFEIKKVTDSEWQPAWIAEVSDPIDVDVPGDGTTQTFTYHGSGDGSLTFEGDIQTVVTVGPPVAPPADPAEPAIAVNSSSDTILSWNSIDESWNEVETVSSGHYRTLPDGRRYYNPSDNPPWGARPGDLWRQGIVTLLVWNGVAWVTGKQYKGPVGTTIQNGVWTINEKVSSPTAKDLRVFVEPSATAEYEFRVTKLSEESGTELFTEVSWESVQEIRRDPMTFYGVGMARVMGQASDQFTSLPTWNGIWDGRIVKVPSNYNAETRTYTGVWDGTYQLAWTTNTAFILQDFIENDSYGLSSVYPHVVNKWKFYEFGQYCDEMVLRPDGSLRPRWTFNDYVQEPRDAKELAQYIAGSAGARYVDDGNGLVDLIIDKDTTALALFAPENIGEDGFSYSYTDRLTRANEIIVEFVNPNLNWQTDKRIIRDEADIAVVGRIQDNFIAVGCTDVDEAMARGRRRLITGLTEKEIVSFTTNRKGKFLSEWDIILVADPDMGRGISGRIRSQLSSTAVSLRDPVSLEAGIEYWATFTIVNPDYPATSSDAFTTIRRKISTGAGSHTSLDFLTALPDLPEYATFSIEAEGVVGFPKPFRITNLQDDSGSGDMIRVAAIELNRNKYAYIDTGAVSETINYTSLGGEIVAPPTDLAISSEVRQKGSVSVRVLTLNWTRSTSQWVRLYKVYHSVNGAPASVYETTDPKVEIEGPDSGDHVFSVIGINLRGRQSQPVVFKYNLTGVARPVAEPSGLRLVGEVAPGYFDCPEPRFEWDAAPPYPGFSHYLVRVMSGSTIVRSTNVGQALEWKYDIVDNKSDNGGNPLRTFDLWVSSVDQDGNESDAVNMTATNLAPAAPTVTVSSAVGGINIKLSTSTERDIAGAYVWVSSTAGFNPLVVAPSEDGDQTSFFVPLYEGEVRYVRAAYYDAYSKAVSDLNISTQVSGARTPVDLDALSAEARDLIDNTATGARLTAEALIQRSLDNWSESLLQTSLSHLNGAPVAALLVEEKQARVDGELAIAETFSLLGAKSTDGLAFILDLATVKVDADETLAQKFTALEFSDSENAASIAEVFSITSDINNTLLATWALTVDVDGLISGIKLVTVGGGGTTTSYLDFRADKIRFFNGSTTEPVFSVEGGNIYLAGDMVRTDSLETGSAVRITADQSIGSSVTIVSRGTLTGHVLVKSMAFQVDQPTSKFTVTVSFNYESTNSNITYIWLKIGNVAPIWATTGSSADMLNADAVYKVAAYNGPATAIFTFDDLPIGANTLEIHGGSTGSGSHSNTANDCYFSVREDKKPL